MIWMKIWTKFAESLRRLKLYKYICHGPAVLLVLSYSIVYKSHRRVPGPELAARAYAALMIDI